MVHSSKFLILRSLDIFKSFRDSQIEQLANQTNFHKIAKGLQIYNTGDEIANVYLLHKGSVKVGMVATDNKILLKDIIYKNELLGENVMTNYRYRKDFAKALEEVEVFSIPVAYFKDMLQKNPQMCQVLTKILINKMSNLEQRMSNFVFKKAQSRIMEFLKKLADTQGIKIGLEEILINHGLSHKEIAHITDTSRQTVARVLGDLKRQNVIHFSSRKPNKILIRNIMNLS